MIWQRFSLFVRYLLDFYINHSILAMRFELYAGAFLCHLSLFLFLRREMTTQTAVPSPVCSAKAVGDAFVERYYKVLLSDPDIVHKFYEDSSVLSRPGLNGVMTTVTTMQGIKDKILSLEYKGYKTQITTVDAQDSCEEGVIVLVTGCLTEDNFKSSFTQTFFLARHAKGYFVLNDVFRFVDVPEAVTPSAVNDANENVASAPLTQNQGSASVSNQLSQNQKSPIEVTSNGSEVCDSTDMNGSVDSKDSVVKEVVVSEQPLRSSQNDEDKFVVSASNNQEHPQKMSYASIVAKEHAVTSPVQISTNTVVIVAPSSTHQNQTASAAPRASALCSNSTPQNNNTRTEVKGIFIGNLPSDVSVKQLYDIFKKFGSIKKEGIQIRNCKDGFCYGFVEFEFSSSARSAIEAHIIMIGSKEAYITEKRYTNQASNGRGRFASGKGEYRNENYRNRGPTERNGEAHQRVNQNGGGRIDRSNGMQ